jgi:hypothetical protein
MNCDLNVYNHIPYKHLQACDYRPKKKNLTKQPFHAKIKVPIVKFSYMGYSMVYYALLELRKVVIFACFNVTIYIKFELLNY